MVPGRLAVLLGTAWLPLGRPIAWAAWVFPAYTPRAVTFLPAWPAAAVQLGRVGLPFVIGDYELLLGGMALARLPAKRRPRLPLTGLASRLPGWMALLGLDVGEGEAVLIESPTGRHVLVGGESSLLALSQALGWRMPLLERRVDWLVLGGTRDEQVAGMERIFERALLAGPPGEGL
jgi:hypothetical protein